MRLLSLSNLRRVIFQGTIEDIMIKMHWAAWNVIGHTLVTMGETAPNRSARFDNFSISGES